MQSELEPIDLCRLALRVLTKMRVDGVNDHWALNNQVTIANYFRQVFKGQKSMDLTFLGDLAERAVELANDDYVNEEQLMKFAE